MPLFRTCPGCGKVVYGDRLRIPAAFREQGGYQGADDLEVARRLWRCRCCVNRMLAQLDWARYGGLVWPVGGAA